MGIYVTVIDPRGLGKRIYLCDNEEQMKQITATQLKEKIIGELLMRGIDIRLIFKGEKLDGEYPLSSYGIQNMSTIRTLPIVTGGGGEPVPGTVGRGMGDKDGRNASNERLQDFETPPGQELLSPFCCSSAQNVPAGRSPSEKNRSLQ